MDSSAAGEGRLAILLSWQTHAACFLHDCHNALRWSMAQYMARSLQQSAWVVMASLRNSHQQLVGTLPAWLGSGIIVFEDGDVDLLRRVWTMCGLSDSLISLLCDLQIRFSNGVLKISDAYVDESQLPQRIATALLALWEFRAWSETRWCGMGRTCRLLVANILTGLPAIVQMILDDPEQSSYHISGWKHLTKPMLRRACVVCASGRVSESCLELVRLDDRLALRLPDVLELLERETRAAVEIDPGILDLFAGVCGVSALDLYGEVVTGVAVQAAFIRNKLREVQCLPWSLVGGDTLGKIRELQRGPRPTENVAAKIVELMDLGYSVNTILQGVSLLGECNFSTKPVEDGHSAAASLLKKHTGYGSSTIASRALLMHARTLFNADRVDTQIEYLRRRLRNLRRKAPFKITSRHVLCKKLSEQAVALRGRGRVLRHGYMQGIIKNHGKVFAGLPHHQRVVLAHEATHMQHDRADRLQVTIRQVQGQLRDALRAQETRAKRGHSMTIGRCRLSPNQVCEFDTLYASEEFASRDFVQGGQDELLQEVGMPDLATRATLGLFPAPEPAPTVAAPAWLPWMTYNREFFKDTVFIFSKGEDKSFYKFIYATQQPHVVTLATLVAREPVDRIVMPEGLHGEDVANFDHVFELKFEFSFSDEGVFAGVDKVEVLENIAWRPPLLCVADGDWTDLGDLRLTLPGPPPREAATKEKKGAKDEDDEALWARVSADDALWACIKENCSKDVIAACGDMLDDVDASSEHSDVDLGVFDEALVSLEERREELVLAAEGALDESPFKYVLRGGRWTAAHHGVCYDCFMTQPASADVRAWCLTVGLRPTASFSIARYEEHPCIVLCEAWISRMAWLHALWHSEGCPSPFVVSEAQQRTWGAPELCCGEGQRRRFCNPRPRDQDVAPENLRFPSDHVSGKPQEKRARFAGQFFNQN